ncbi:MAG: metallophosphoesterase [Cytophagaceae bacterium]|nr:metallophosphoesterase [Cytophagaceae bacterium]
MQRRLFLKTGLTLASAWPTLTLAGRPPELKLRFATASDGHYGQPGVDSQRDFADLVKWMQTEKGGTGLDFVVVNGDLFHDDPKFLPNVKTAFERFPVPYFVTRGNHDMVSGEVWQQTWGYGLNHSFVRGDYAVVLADTSDGKGGYVCPDARWLGAELAKYADKKGVFVFMHIAAAKWTTHGIDCAEVMALLQKTPNVLATFHGHDHNEDQEKLAGGKPFFWDGHFGGNWGTTYKGYRIVEVFADESWRSYQCNPDRSPIINTYEAQKPKG